MQPEQTAPEVKPTNGLRGGLLCQLPVIIALLIIGGMLIAWKPWQAGANASDRIITVTGEAEITAEPDEYIFNPRYEFKNADKKAALSEATAKINEIVKKLKALGVSDSKIKTDTSGYDAYYFYGEGQQTYYASVNIKVNDKNLGQKVQDYLLTTTPYGEVTPQADFSKAKRKQLTDNGRDQATKDARAKAEQSAENLGFKLGKVKSVKDDPNQQVDIYYGRSLQVGADSVSSSETAPIQGGENDLTYQVTVTYYLR